MGKIKKFRDWNIKTAFVFYVLMAFAAAVVLTLITQNAINAGEKVIRDYYEMSAQTYILPRGGSYEVWFDEQNNVGYWSIFDIDGNIVERFKTENGSEVTFSYNGDVVGGNLIGPNVLIYSQPMAGRHKFIYGLYTFLSFLSVPVCFGGAVITCAFMFYRVKLKKPLEILSDASNKIAQEDLDFTIEYDRKDEMGKLCMSFEHMRQALMENNRQMWRHVEQRKRLNAAFAHDLRTPLTILKGYTEELASMSDSFTPQQLQQTAEVMFSHVMRLEKYTSDMSSMQKLEDIQANPIPLGTAGFAGSLSLSAQMLCMEAGKKFIFKNCIRDDALCIDKHIVMQVYENLINNAVRFAVSSVTVEASVDDGYLRITVDDDGNGFTKEALDRASEPFYTSSGKEHFGLGLYICKVLCAKHKGSLSLGQNEQQGAKVTAEFKLMW